MRRARGRSLIPRDLGGAHRRRGTPPLQPSRAQTRRSTGPRALTRRRRRRGSRGCNRPPAPRSRRRRGTRLREAKARWRRGRTDGAETGASRPGSTGAERRSRLERVVYPPVALATATELDFVSLPDALDLVLLLIDDPRRFRRAALRWHARYCAEISDVGFEERILGMRPLLRRDLRRRLRGAHSKLAVQAVAEREARVQWPSSSVGAGSSR